MDLTVVSALFGDLYLERLPDGRFIRRGRLPSWCQALNARAVRGDEPFALEEDFPFLSVFLPEAEACWRAGLSTRAGSGFWTETDDDGHDIHLEATAARAGGADVLVIRRDERLFAEQQLVLQRARELSAAHRALMRELEQRDILVHAIVHDLAAPLNSILGALSLLSEQSLCAQEAKLVQIALQAAHRQRELIREVLDVFSAEYGGFAEPRLPSAPGADIERGIATVVAEAEPAARARGVTISSALGSGPWRVVGEPMRLVRVLANLVDNAVRHNPPGGRVTVSARRENDTVYVDVDDDGPGVPASVLPHLFERFARGRERAAGTGLGLYFCRITVEEWGGGIGYEPRAQGGARFWLRFVIRRARDTDGGAAAR